MRSLGSPNVSSKSLRSRWLYCLVSLIEQYIHPSSNQKCDMCKPTFRSPLSMHVLLAPWRERGDFLITLYVIKNAQHHPSIAYSSSVLPFKTNMTQPCGCSYPSFILLFLFLFQSFLSWSQTTTSSLCFLCVDGWYSAPHPFERVWSRAFALTPSNSVVAVATQEWWWEGGVFP